MEHLYIRRVGDANVITNYKESFELDSLEELVKKYNKQVKCGITGVHQQALYLVALGMEFNERLNQSPAYLINHVLGLVGEICIRNGNIRIV